MLRLSLLSIAIILLFSANSGSAQGPARSFLQKLEIPTHPTQNLNEAQTLIANQADSFFELLEKQADSLGKTLNQYLSEKIISNLNTTAWTTPHNSSEDQNMECLGCKLLVAGLKSGYDNPQLIQSLLAIGKKLCSNLFNETACDTIINDFGSLLIGNIVERLFEPEVTCWGLGFCPHTYYIENFTEYAKDVLSQKNESEQVPKPTGKSTYKVLHITDLHADPNYTEGSESDCDKPMCCTKDSGAPKDPKNAAGYWGTVGKGLCDIPMRTLEQAFRFISEEIKPEIVIWTGDNIAHDIQNQNQSGQYLPTKIDTDLFKTWLPESVIYPIHGNHEFYPADQYDFFGNSTAWLTGNLSILWKDYLDASAQEMLRDKGYYTMLNSQRNLRVIALDTQACDSLNFYLLRNPTDPTEQLVWLRDILEESEKNKEAVFIFAHISPGQQFCSSHWSKHFAIIVERYSKIIKGQFYGHEHHDQFEVFNGFFDNLPKSVALVTPSLTTFSGENPSFRVYEVDADTNTLINYKEYTLNLTKANERREGNLTWEIAYDFLSEYKLPDMSPESFAQLSEAIFNDDSTAKTYISHYYADSSFGQIPTWMARTKALKRIYGCETKNTVVSEKFKCLGLLIANDPTNFAFMALEFAQGRWFYPEKDGLEEVHLKKKSKERSVQF